MKNLELFFAELANIAEPANKNDLNLLIAFQKHLEMVNQTHNTTRILNETDFWNKHVFDSLAILLHYPQIQKCVHIADVGCGGGIPLVPLAIYLPSIQFTGIDSASKKIQSIREFITQNTIKNIQLADLQAREAGRSEIHKKQYDLIISRAVMSSGKLLKECKNLIKEKGCMIFYKTPQAIEKEHSELVRNAQKLQMNISYSKTFSLPNDSGERQFVNITTTS